jgi:hypothetical protein
MITSEYFTIYFFHTGTVDLRDVLQDTKGLARSYSQSHVTKLFSKNATNLPHSHASAHVPNEPTLFIPIARSK